VSRAALLAVATVLALAGCGGESSGDSADAGGALAETASSLGKIRSGDLTLDLRVSSEENEAGFRLEGPFAFAEGADALPVAELEYTQVAGDQEATVTFVSTGDRAWIVANGEAQELSGAQLDQLRGSGVGGGEAGSALGQLEIGDWFVEPELTDGGEVGGAETDKIVSELDVVAATRDFLELAGALGGGTSLDDGSEEQLRRAVASARIEVWTGKEDRLLRRLLADVAFEAKPPPELEGLYGTLPGAEVHLEFGVSDPNGDVTVEPPDGA
jgi:hypothetical protein